MGAAGGGGETRGTARAAETTPPPAAIAAIIAAAAAAAAAAAVAAAAAAATAYSTTHAVATASVTPTKVGGGATAKFGGDDGLDGLIARLNYWAGHYKAHNGDEKRMQESEWERGILDPGVVFGFFVGWGSEPGRRRLTRPRRERVREKEKDHLPASITLYTGMPFI